MRVLQKRGYDNLYGIDPSDFNLSFLKSCGIKGISSALPGLKGINTKFDVIILSHVLEHVYDLGTVATKLTSLLCDNGILYIEVPDAEKYDTRFFSPYHYFDFEHINHFNSFYISYLFSKEGTRTLSVFDKDTHPYYICGCILTKNTFKTLGKKEEYLSAYLENMYNYLASSHKQNIINRAIMSNIRQRDTKTYLWGAGAYLRAQIKAGLFDGFNLCGIIDKNSSMQGTFIPDSTGKKMIEIFDPSILENEDNKTSTVFVTSVLYREQICCALKEMKHRGDVHCL